MKATTARTERRRNMRWDLYTIVAVAAWVVLQPAYISFKDSRLYRDLMGITPFSKVSVTSATLEPDGIIVRGLMQKDRCDFDRLIGYITLENGISFRVAVDDSVERDAGGNTSRPVSGRLETWGPWKLRYNSGLGKAVEWDVFVAHKNCTTPPERQTNHFAGGRWNTATFGE